MRLSPAMVAFGGVRKGLAAGAQVVEVRNEGDVDLAIAGFALTGPHAANFSVTPTSAPFTLTPGGKASFTVSLSESNVAIANTIAAAATVNRHA